MKFKLFLAAAALALSASAETPFVNLTPAPKEMTVSEGSFVLRPGFTISALGHDVEIARFISAIDAATALAPKRVEAGDEADIKILDINCNAEHYELTVTADGVTIGCAADEGLYYAFQTLKKILPANVMAAVREEKEYALPLLSVKDEPRMEYRGFMLDVSRHFFTVEEVKRMIEVMSYYKMNKFHWHLTDDQGWRIEMPDYPRLTTVGATAQNCEIVDMYTKTDYWLNKTYGPYFYTQDQLREVVAYAAERHIDIIPEVEMPGHFSAVMAAYPEFSLNPEGGHSVAVTGGVYGDVMNLANPAAIKFAEDVIDVLCDIFPSEIIHIGGDECPEGGWVKLEDGKIKSGNQECIAMYRREKCTHPRQLQSIFTKHMADYAATKGRKIGVWNESITAGGTDEKLIKQTDATVWCWTGADGAVNKATNLGLRAIYTPINKSSDTKGSFYINRSQSPDDPPANGNKVDDVKSVYNTIPFTTQALKNNPELCYGVQGTFWCERVAYREYLEYLALPRLLAIAEIGWTPQEGKNWESFQKRMSADRELLEYNDYKYSTYHMLDLQPAPQPEVKPLAPFEVGATYYFENTADLFAGHFLADGSATLQHASSPWDNANLLWTVTEATANDDATEITFKLASANGKSPASVGNASGREAKPVNMGTDAMTLTARATTQDGILTLHAGSDELWLSHTGNVRAGETKNGGGVSPIQGTTWRAAKASMKKFNIFINNELNSSTSRPVADNTTDFSPLAPQVKAHTLQSATLNNNGEIDCHYQANAHQVFYSGFLEDGTPLYSQEELLPLGSTDFTIPEIDGFTLVSTDEPIKTPLYTSIRSTYSTTAHIGAKEATAKITELKAGKPYLIRDAHSDRNAWRGETASATVNGTKIASNLSPMFVWTLDGSDNKFKVQNHATENYITALKKSSTAKTGANGEIFTFTFNDETQTWAVKGRNGLYWDGLDNLDLVGWDGGTGHPIEVYDFYAAPFHSVTVNYVDNHGAVLETKTYYAPAGETFVLGQPYRLNHTITAIEGAEELKNLSKDVTVNIVYTLDTELSIREIGSDIDAANGEIYDLQGRRVAKPSRGLYIINGKKFLITNY